MIENEILKAKIKTQLKALRLNEEQEGVVVRELNYLANLLIDIYMKETEMVANKKMKETQEPGEETVLQLLAGNVNQIG